MSKNGTIYRHGKTVGYVVVMRPMGYVGSVCHGYEDPTTRTLLGGRPGTLFKTLRAAKRVVDEAKPQPGNEGMRYTIVRVAPLA